MKVFAGDASAGGPVLKSTENSKVFFYFADHGAPGLVAMASGPTMSAKELNDAFKAMHAKKMYKEMVVYMEACESGSMFENGLLPDNLSIYALSAANGHESSWGTYCPPDDKVNGKHLGTCLGDLFSVNWMEDSDKASMGSETIEMQFDSVQKSTNKSHVLEWGDKTFTGEDIGEFQSN
jgi:legumain